MMNRIRVKNIVFLLASCFVYAAFIASVCILSSCAGTPAASGSNNGADLFELIEQNKVDEVRELFSFKEDSNRRNEKGETPLHAAALQNSAEMTAMILAAGGEIDAKDNDGVTPLLAAARNDCYKSAAVLSKQGADIFARSNDGECALDAAIKKNGEALSAVVDSNNVNKRSGEGSYPLHEAVKALNENAVKFMLTVGAHAEQRDARGALPLAYAYARSDSLIAARIAAVLLERGAAPAYGEFDYFEKSVLKSDSSLKMDDGQTPLHYAASRGHIGFARYLLERGALVNAKDVSSSSPLHDAVRSGNLEIAEILLDAGADANAVDANNNTPLHLVMPIESRLEGLRLLLRYNADPNAKDIYGDAPLHIAVSIGMEAPVIYCLLDAGADINARNKEGLTALAVAIDRKRLPLVNLLVSAGADIYAEDASDITPLERSFNSSPEIFYAAAASDRAYSRDSRGNTALHIAASTNCRTEYAEALIAKSADVNARNRDGDTALHIAVRKNYSKIGEILLANGADVFAVNVFGESPLSLAFEYGASRSEWLLTPSVIGSADARGNAPLHYAAEWRLDEYARFIIQRGGKADVSNENGETPLFSAVKTDGVSVASVLIENGAKVNSRDCLGNSPLHLCVRWSAEKTAGLLIGYNADPNARNLSGKTPLHESVRGNGSWNILELLLASGCDTDASDETGKTALMEAISAGNYAAAKRLLQAGASPFLPDMTGRTAYHYAVESGDENAVALIRDANGNPLARDAFGNTPFSLAINIMPDKAMIVANGNTDAADSDGNTFLHIAVAESAPSSLLRTLISSGFPVNRRNSAGATALLIAVQNDNVDAINELLDVGADPFLADRQGNCAVTAAFEGNAAVSALMARAIGNKSDMFGNTILHYAAMKAAPETVRQLLTSGLERGVKNISGETPRDVAIRWGRAEIAELFL